MGLRLNLEQVPHYRSQNWFLSHQNGHRFPDTQLHPPSITPTPGAGRSLLPAHLSLSFIAVFHLEGAISPSFHLLVFLPLFSPSTLANTLADQEQIAGAVNTTSNTRPAPAGKDRIPTSVLMESVSSTTWQVLPHIWALKVTKVPRQR